VGIDVVDVMFVGCDHLGGWGRRKLGSERGCGVNCARVDRHMRGTSHLHPRCFSAPKAGANRLWRRTFTCQLRLVPMRLPPYFRERVLLNHVMDVVYET
jgi:hypothetical protein